MSGDVTLMTRLPHPPTPSRLPSPPTPLPRSPLQEQAVAAQAQAQPDSKAQVVISNGPAAKVSMSAPSGSSATHSGSTAATPKA